MTDNLLYAKLPPPLKRSSNLTFLDNRTTDQIVEHHGRELQLSDLENDGKLSIATKTAVPPNDDQQNTELSKIVCHYCKKTGHFIRDCPSKMKKEQEQRNDTSFQNTKPLTSKTYALCLHCHRTNHPREKCWNGPNTANRSNRLKQDQPAENAK